MSEAVSQTRDALLDAAEHLFGERGHEAVGIREIAERAGANLASIKYHFGSKHELYLATVRRAMARAEGHSPWAMLEAEPDAGPRPAARRLVRFIRTYLERLLTSGPHESCGTLMLWEAIQPSEAIDAVVRDYIQPSQDRLVSLVGALLVADDQPDAALFARSILAQILHYRICRPFIERLEDGKTDAVRAATHIARFSLRAMGHDDAFIDRVLVETDASELEPTPAGPQAGREGGAP